MKISSYKAGDIIMKKGTTANQKIVVIIEGSLKKAKSGITVASKAQAWGEEYLLDNNKSKTFDDDIVMETEGVIAEISSENFVECIGGQIEEVIKQNEKNHEVISAPTPNYLPNNIIWLSSRRMVVRRGSLISLISDFYAKGTWPKSKQRLFSGFKLKCLAKTKIAVHRIGKQKKMMKVDPKKRDEMKNIKITELVYIKTIGKKHARIRSWSCLNNKKQRK